MSPGAQSRDDTPGGGGIGRRVGAEPRRSKVYVANSASNDVLVIDTATNTVIATIPVGSHPVALGLFIQPAAKF